MKTRIILSNENTILYPLAPVLLTGPQRKTWITQLIWWLLKKLIFNIQICSIASSCLAKVNIIYNWHSQYHNVDEVCLFTHMMAFDLHIIQYSSLTLKQPFVCLRFRLLEGEGNGLIPYHIIIYQAWMTLISSFLQLHFSKSRTSYRYLLFHIYINLTNRCRGTYMFFLSLWLWLDTK